MLPNDSGSFLMGCISLFVKDPWAGEAKSRLGRIYDNVFRKGLAESFLKDMLRVVDNLEGVEKILNYSPLKSADRMGRYLPSGWRLLAQEEGDLGRRMECFFQWAFSNGYNRAVLIGSDFPSLPAQFLKRAFDLLKTRSPVLGPSTDGGYYLIGLSRPCPEMFREIEWSSAKVFAQTVDRGGDNLGLLPPWYDVDYPHDLSMLAGHLKGMIKAGNENLPGHTIRFLQRHKLI